MGVEEEFLLLDPSGPVAPRAAEVLRRAGCAQLTPEFMAYQVETATTVCTRLDEVRAELTRLRLDATEAAERSGVRLVALGAPPFARTVRGHTPAAMVTDDARYHELVRRFPYAAPAGGACACQVHIGVPDRDLAVEVLVRLRPWLPVLLALTGNSPIRNGVDSGWSSTRYRSQLPWPTFRAPQPWANAEHYDHAVRAFIASGVAHDPASVYFLARLSARYPTVEVRVADAALTVEDAVLLAGLVRGLVATLIEDVRHRRPGPPAAPDRVEASLLAAARLGPLRPDGLAAPAAARAALAGRLWRRIRPALDAVGDADEIRTLLERLARDGTGADRQRALWSRTRTPAGFVAAVADATAPAAVF
jgi:carboxylate-amine ligase